MESADPSDLRTTATATATATDLPSTIALLLRLSSLAFSTLRSLPFPFPPPRLLPSCPHNPQHRIPPSSLFPHSLRCPSPLPLPYKTPTLPSLSPPTSPALLPSPSSDLCFSLDPPSDPIYHNCPGVVRFPRPDDSPKSFLLPSTLAADCANFPSHPPTETPTIRVLPSELYAARSEVAAWANPPCSYSYNVLRLASCLDLLADAQLRDWILRNSPRWHGVVVIGSAMADRVLLLLRLCLKAAWREAAESLRLVLDGEMTRVFDCPRLRGSVMWLGTQLGILYGEEEAGRFALEMIKEGIVRAGAGGVLIGKEAGGGWEGGKEVARVRPPGGFFSEGIFVSQVAAAITALHEWLLLERRIRELRSSTVRLRSEILCEHLYTSEKANEERGRRSDYRPLLEHDGLIWKQSHIEDKGRPKTRVEMLAEERDYKRRRMSYRGKKVKRTPIQVLHDIIEEHMEEIRRAGGIGCHVKGATGVAVQHLGSKSENAERVNMQKARSATSETHKSNTNLYNKQIFEDNSSRLTTDNRSSYLAGMSDDADDVHSKPQYEYDKKRGHMERRDAYRESSSSLTYQSTQNTRSLEERYSRHDQHSPNSYRYKDDRSRSRHLKYSSSKEHKPLSDSYTSSKERHYKYYDTDSLSHSTFEDRYDPYSSYTSTSRSFKDRYDPSGSSDIYEDDCGYARSKYSKKKYPVDDASGGLS